MNIFVGNLSFDATEGDIKKIFEDFGNVASVVILKRKEQKAPKSRGFGFVDMPDEQQALAAIAGINGKEFMGRALSVEPARPKVEAKAGSKPKKKREPKPHALKAPRPNGRVGTPPSAVDRRVRPFEQPEPGSYKGGRRSVSYMKRQGLAAVHQEANPRRRNQENPMRWRKRADQPKPWQKSPGGHKPWEKIEGEARPWKKAEGESKPWKKAEGESKPWKKSAGDAKPWSKSSKRPRN